MDPPRPPPGGRGRFHPGRPGRGAPPRGAWPV